MMKLKLLSLTIRPGCNVSQIQKLRVKVIVNVVIARCSHNAKDKFCHPLKSFDGTDFRIREHSPFSTKWWSFKFNRPGLRHEIAKEAEYGNIVWVYGVFPCGEFLDLIIARKKCVQLLRPGEKVVADRGTTMEGALFKRMLDHCITRKDRRRLSGMKNSIVV